MHNCFIVTISAHTADFLVYGRNSYLLAEEHFDYAGNWNELAKGLKQYFNKYSRTTKDLYLILNMDGDYTRAVFDREKQKAELKLLAPAENREYLAYVSTQTPDGKFVYSMLSYPATELLKYINFFQKLKLRLRAAVPLDLLSIRITPPGIYLETGAGNSYLKVYDQLGNFYRKKIPNPQNLSKELPKILMYLKREKMLNELDSLPVQEKSPELTEVVKLLSEVESNEQLVVYRQTQESLLRKKIKLDTRQKTAGTFLALVVLLVICGAIIKYYQLWEIKRDIRTYAQELNKIKAHYTELAQLEKDTKELKQARQQKINNPLLGILNLAAENKIEVRDLTRLPGKPIAFSGFDRREQRHEFIRALEKSASIQAVNLVAEEYDGSRVKFRLVITERQNP